MTEEKNDCKTSFLPPLRQYDNYNVVKLLSQWEGKLVNASTRWMWSGEAKNSWATDLADASLPDQNHTINRQEDNSNLINLCRLWLSKCFHLFNFLLSGPLLLQPKEKCVLHPHCLPFTVYSSLPLPFGPSSKITRMFCSASCYNLLPVG